jgi:hypothetical protein
MLSAAQLRSVMWNIDSLDWADPVPSSIADRVLRTVDKEGRGIILFHDIHERTVKALPACWTAGRRGLPVRRLGRQQASRWPRAASRRRSRVPSATGYSELWAIVIGIDDYAKWPKLQYAVRDAGRSARRWCSASASARSASSR